MPAPTAMPVEAMHAVTVGRILIATDFSTVSETALSYAMQLSEFYSASLYVLHVATPALKSVPTMEFESLREDDGLKWGEEQFALLEKSAILSRHRHRLMLETGEPSKVVRDVVAQNQIDLVVVGTHGHGGLMKVLAGSVAEEVFRDVVCPVLTVGRRAVRSDRRRFERVLFATESLEGSSHALPYALSLAEGGADLVMLHVLTRGGWIPSGAHRLIRESEEWLQALIRPEQAAAIRLRVVAEFGSPAEVIGLVASQERADLIVMGAHPSSNRAATHLPWTVAHRVVHAAHCPVLTVRAKAAE